MGCPQCTDPDGAECFPLYGIGPHTHRPGPVIGSTVPRPKEQWPKGYTEDPDCPGMGTWWCPHCECGKPPKAELTGAAPMQADVQTQPGVRSNDR